MLGTTARQLETSRFHERVHVMQYERWGPVFPLAYVASSLSALLHGQNPYHGNRFEKEANRLAKRRRLRRARAAAPRDEGLAGSDRGRSRTDEMRTAPAT